MKSAHPAAVAVVAAVIAAAVVAVATEAIGVVVESAEAVAAGIEILKGGGNAADAAAATILCPLPEGLRGDQVINAELSNVLEKAGCPLAVPVQQRLRFENFLADLSATFISVPADQVDSQIVAGLRQIVEFLGIDRSGLSELRADKNKMKITHSYEVPGVPSTPRIYVEDHWPDIAKKVREGEPFRVPEDLPAEASAEREYVARVGLKSRAYALRLL